MDLNKYLFQMNQTLERNEVLFQHGFKTILIDLESEKSKTIESLLKKYKDNLFISVPLSTLLITESSSNNIVGITDEAKSETYYIINLRHDAKG